MLWIYQAQSNDVRWLQERHNPIWNEWMVDADGIYRIYEPVTEDYDPNKEVLVYDLFGHLMPNTAKSLIEGKNIKTAKYYGSEYAYNIGTAYGWIVNRYKLIDRIIKILKEDPNCRRMVISLWQDEWLKTAVLPSCVWSSMLKVSGNKLNMMVQQRSCDTPLGLPFNVSQYAILLNMLAKEACLEAGNLSWNIADCHIYENQIEGVGTQLIRYDLLKKYEEFIDFNTPKMVEYAYNELLSKSKTICTNEVKEEVEAFGHLITRENPYLELASEKNFYTYSNEVINDKEYKAQNPTANEDIKVRKYTHRPFIKFPIAQ